MRRFVFSQLHHQHDNVASSVQNLKQVFQLTEIKLQYFLEFQFQICHPGWGQRQMKFIVIKAANKLA